jgi:hypothetical protein
VTSSTGGSERQASAAPAPASAPAAAPLQSGAQSFPLADPKPGSEPK